MRIEDTDIELAPEDLDVRYSGPPGVAFLWEGKAFVALDTAITPELRQEGIARDFVRAIQDQRKELGMHVLDRILNLSKKSI